MEHAPIAETARTSQFRPLAMAVAEGFELYFAVLVRRRNRVCAALSNHCNSLGLTVTGLKMCSRFVGIGPAVIDHRGVAVLAARVAVADRHSRGSFPRATHT